MQIPGVTKEEVWTVLTEEKYDGEKAIAKLLVQLDYAN
jgi:hypothetical protein